MNIAGVELTNEAEPYVIAEIGVNHDGDPDRALELTDAAAQAGASAVKVQLFRAELLLGPAAPLATYQRAAGETDARAMLRRLELSADQLRAVADRAHDRNLHAICTVFTPELVAEAETIPFDAYKAASPDLINRLLIEQLARTGKPLILSTGAATLEEIQRTLSWIPTAHDNLALMHCVSAYPTPEEDAALAAIRELTAHFNLPTGYSDHTAATDTSALAVATGASFLEKHLTHSRSAPGPDHAASLEPNQFAEYVAHAKRARRMLGNPHKAVQSIEQDVRSAARQSLSLARAVPAGQIIEETALTTRRPATALSASCPELAIGRPAARDLAPGDLLTEEDLA